MDNLDECTERSNFLCLVYIFEVWILHSECMSDFYVLSDSRSSYIICLI